MKKFFFSCLLAAMSLCSTAWAQSPDSLRVETFESIDVFEAEATGVQGELGTWDFTDAVVTNITDGQEGVGAHAALLHAVKSSIDLLEAPIQSSKVSFRVHNASAASAKVSLYTRAAGATKWTQLTSTTNAKAVSITAGESKTITFEQELEAGVALRVYIPSGASVYVDNFTLSNIKEQEPEVDPEEPEAPKDSTGLWWGYYDGVGTRSGLGVKATETYHQCSYYSDAVVGKTIKALRFYMSASNVKDVKVWISKSRPASADKADVACKSVNVSSLNTGDSNNNYGSANEVWFDEPYTVVSGGIYVGCSYTITKASQGADQYPIVLCEEAVEGGCYIKTSSSAPTWADYGTQYGALAQQLLLGGDFPTNGAVPTDFADGYVALGGEYQLPLTVTCQGTAGIYDFNYTVSTDGVAGPEQHFALTTPVVNYGLSTVVRLSLAADAECGTTTKVITITKVNGQPNEAADNSATGKLNTVQKLFTHRVAIEEFTGTGCGWCPRGLQGMENLRQAFGDQFVGIGLHKYNSSDPMYPANYASVSFGGAPSCRIERGAEMDPYYGTNNSIIEDFQQALDQIAEVGVEVKGTWTDDTRKKVDVSATVEAIADGNKYDVELVLIADGLTGSSSAWRQANYYYQYSASQVPDDLRQFASGGQYGSSYISGWVFNDVAIASTCTNATNAVPTLGTLSAYQPVTAAYTLAMPTKTALLNAIQYDQVYAVALVVNKSTKKIVNAAKALVTDAGSEGINEVVVDEFSNASAPCYDLQGRRVEAPRQGQLFIQNGQKCIVR